MTVDFKKSKLKYHLKVKNGREVTNEVNYDDNVIDVYGSGGVFKYTDKKLFTGPSVLFGRKGTIGKPLYVEGDFWTVDTMYYTEIYSGNSPRYFYYLLEVFPWNQIVTQTALPSIVGSEVENYELNIPSEETQKIIAKYLECKCVEIEALLNHKEHLITLLEQQRLSIITEAVTKGLNPNVKMKDSGIEWIGVIPDHWGSLTFRRVTSLQQGLQIAQEERFYEDGFNRYEYITVKSLNYQYHVKEYVENPSHRVICNENEVLLARTGATGLVVTGVSGAFHNNFFKVNFNSGKVIKDYLVYYLKQAKIQEHFQLVAGTTTIPDLNHGSFYDTALVLPDLNEQQEIVTYLDLKLKNLERLKDKIGEQVEKLHEYRQSLIYEAVTGKIDVSDMELDEVR
ncbi:MAG: restriction endonuclease subunit S [Paenibacillus sp.]|uniref:restriction endonuclease subunit S n=1 Tax=Paenibacillus sp. TaxID=58172 RepID=UPI0025D633BD|nr:restriction endonuclease subunit S [Paenibacillus sp.]MBR2562990.1 restriction endonuclease subunit S [Paenibacillus sp.]